MCHLSESKNYQIGHAGFIDFHSWALANCNARSVSESCMAGARGPGCWHWRSAAHCSATEPQGALRSGGATGEREAAHLPSEFASLDWGLAARPVARRGIRMRGWAPVPIHWHLPLPLGFAMGLAQQLLLALLLPAPAPAPASLLPKWPPTFNMSESTIVMPW